MFFAATPHPRLPNLWMTPYWPGISDQIKDQTFWLTFTHLEESSLFNQAPQFKSLSSSSLLSSSSWLWWLTTAAAPKTHKNIRSTTIATIPQSWSSCCCFCYIVVYWTHNFGPDSRLLGNPFQSQGDPEVFLQSVRSGTRSDSQGVVRKCLLICPDQDVSVEKVFHVQLARSVRQGWHVEWEAICWGWAGLDHGLLVRHTDAQLFPSPLYLTTLYMPIHSARFI